MSTMIENNRVNGWVLNGMIAALAILIMAISVGRVHYPPQPPPLRQLQKAQTQAQEPPLLQQNQQSQLGCGDTPAVRELTSLYRKKLLPVEKEYQLDRFDLPEITDAEMTSLPVVLLLGQYSTGKTSFIRHMLNMDYPDIHISPEPSTDKFTAVVYGTTNQTINGNLLVGVDDLPFGGLQKFGYKFLDKFGAAVTPAPMLQKFHFLDTPGVLSGEKQRTQRGYDYPSVAKWLAARSDLILLFFDCSKLDISDEFRGVIEALRPYENRVKWVLNKADELDQGTLLRVFGAVMAAVGNIFRTVEKPRVYIGSFHDKPLIHPEHSALFERDRADLMTMFDMLPATCIMRKISEMQKRIRRVQAHMCLMDHLRSSMPMSLFGYELGQLLGYEPGQRWLISNLPAIYEAVVVKSGLSIGDFPALAEYSTQLGRVDFRAFPALDEQVYNDLESLLKVDMMRITQMVVRGSRETVEHNQGKSQDKEE